LSQSATPAESPSAACSSNYVSIEEKEASEEYAEDEYAGDEYDSAEPAETAVVTVRDAAFVTPRDQPNSEKPTADSRANDESLFPVTASDPFATAGSNSTATTSSSSSEPIVSTSFDLQSSVSVPTSSPAPAPALDNNYDDQWGDDTDLIGIG
jgi:hypothetical protein